MLQTTRVPCLHLCKISKLLFLLSPFLPFLPTAEALRAQAESTEETSGPPTLQKAFGKHAEFLFPDCSTGKLFVYPIILRRQVRNKDVIRYSDGELARICSTQDPTLHSPENQRLQALSVCNHLQTTVSGHSTDSTTLFNPKMSHERCFPMEAQTVQPLLKQFSGLGRASRPPASGPLAV